ncbi:MAG: DeoR/GlpR family DNA-binding transcription regulator [Candidatus Omnitrophica bacterium]|nr:DeoR/GlpR family DNA-binding transcription regulator [Candidatus Omnitrophota bacterium]MCM8830361.1 DeoR/GlpR family DNA-binding transcription regulator [Candidatus Omnitrophota bacterium]
MGIKSIKNKEKIVEVLEKKGVISVSELAPILKVSEFTIRRYLEELEKEGILIRTYGGAVKKDNGISSGFFFGEKAKKNINEKKLIAELAFSLIKDGETIFLDTGTTTLEIARLLKRGEKNLVVATNSFPVVSELSQVSYIKVFVIGGFLRNTLMDFAGPFSTEEIGILSFDQAFLGADGISADRGLTTTDTTSAEIEEAVMDRARTINIVADFSKIGRDSLIPYGRMKERKNIRIITDFRANKKELKKIQDAGIEVKIAYPIEKVGRK